jgi:hypothetical protein
MHGVHGTSLMLRYLMSHFYVSRQIPFRILQFCGNLQFCCDQSKPEFSRSKKSSDHLKHLGNLVAAPTRSEISCSCRIPEQKQAIRRIPLYNRTNDTESRVPLAAQMRIGKVINAVRCQDILLHVDVRILFSRISG